MVDFEFIYNSPEKIRLRNRIKYLTHEYQTKMRKLHQSIRRKSNYIETLTNTLDELKKERLLNDEQVEILQNLGEPVSQIIKRQLNRKSHLSQHRQYEPALRAFALTCYLHYIIILRVLMSMFVKYLIIVYRMLKPLQNGMEV